jgi:hypothetical protein
MRLLVAASLILCVFACSSWRDTHRPHHDCQHCCHARHDHEECCNRGANEPPARLRGTKASPGMGRH